MKIYFWDRACDQSRTIRILYLKRENKGTSMILRKHHQGDGKETHKEEE